MGSEPLVRHGDYLQGRVANHAQASGFYLMPLAGIMLSAIAAVEVWSRKLVHLGDAQYFVDRHHETAGKD
jgi:hypothetical protein